MLRSPGSAALSVRERSKGKPLCLCSSTRTVFDDGGAADMLTGGSALDWFLVSNGDGLTDQDPDAETSTLI